MRFVQVMPTAAQMAADPVLAADVADFDAMTKSALSRRQHINNDHHMQHRSQ